MAKHENLNVLITCSTWTYDSVLIISSNLAKLVVHYFTATGVACPPEPHKGVFTVVAVDNVDNDPRTTTTKSSFHGNGTVAPTTYVKVSYNRYLGLQRTNRGMADDHYVTFQNTTLMFQQRSLTWRWFLLLWLVDLLLHEALITCSKWDIKQMKKQMTDWKIAVWLSGGRSKFLSVCGISHRVRALNISDGQDMVVATT